MGVAAEAGDHEGAGEEHEEAVDDGGHGDAGAVEEAEGDAEGEAAPAAKPESGPFDGIEDELTDHMRDRIKKKLKKDMDQKDLDEALNPEDQSSSNENVQKQAVRLRLDDMVPDRSRVAAFGGAISVLCRHASSDADLLNKVAMLNSEYGVDISVPIYRAALRLGTTAEYGSLKVFERACRAALGRQATLAEAKILIRLGKLFSLRGQARGENKSNLAVANSEGETR